MFHFDFGKFKADGWRNLCLVFLVIIAIVGFISAFAFWLHWLMLILVSVYSFLTVGPVLFSVFDADSQKEGHLAWTCSKAAESAAMAMLGVLVLGVTAGFASGAAGLGESPNAHLFSLIIMLSQLVVTVSISLATGLTAALRNRGITLEAPPKPEPTEPSPAFRGNAAYPPYPPQEYPYPPQPGAPQPPPGAPGAFTPQAPSVSDDGYGVAPPAVRPPGAPTDDQSEPS